MIDGAREGIPRWPLVLMRIYAGLVLLGVGVVQWSVPGGSLAAAVDEITGAALLCGVGTPAAALLAIAIVLARMLPIHSPWFLVSPGPRVAYLLLLLTVGLGRAGRLFGVDALMIRRYPRLPLW